ncbi:MAG: MraY family glycosyltransferase [Bacteroidota bacterium]
MIRAVILKNRLIEQPNSRSSHHKIVPSFGGLAFFLVLIVGILITPEIIEKVFHSCQLGYIKSLVMRALLTLALITTVYTGIKDDNKILSPIKKLFGQIMSAGLIASFDIFRINNLYGLFNVHELPLFLSLILSIIFIVGVMNAFNLIDGIDGNAALNGICISSFFCFFFFVIKSMFFIGICIMIIGSLSAFARYNLSRTKKIFMGDTGSLTLGLVFSVLALRLLNIQEHQFEFNFLEHHDIPIVVITILFLPILDVFRVVMIRLKQKKPIWKPDRNHIHHRIIDIGFTHRKASLTINILNLLFTFLVILTLSVYGTIYGLITFFVFTILSIIFLDFLEDYHPKSDI